MDQLQPVKDFICVFRRRWMIWVSVVIIGAVLSALYALNQPRSYETSAIIQITSNEISNQVTTGQTRSNSAQYLHKIEQRIMARDNLAKVVDRLQLFSDIPGMTLNQKIDVLRVSTRITQISDPQTSWRPDSSPSALTVTVQMAERDLVAPVANDFVNGVIEENRQSRVAKAIRTFEFFKGEEERVGIAIAGLDAEIAAYKRLNASSLPTAIAAQRTLLVSLEDAVLDIDQQLVDLLKDKSKIRASDYKKQVAALQQQRNLVTERVDAINLAIDAAPVVERDFNTLKRQLQQLEDQYSVITQNRSQAEVAQMLETGVQAESLIVLEKALIPEHPVGPNRKKVVAIGTFFSFMLAAGLLIILELLNPVIRTAAQLERQMKITPVVTISVIDPPKQGWFDRLRSATS